MNTFPDDLAEFLRRQLDVQEARGDAMAFPPPGYKPDPDLSEQGTWLMADADAKRQVVGQYEDARKEWEKWGNGDGSPTARQRRAHAMGSLEAWTRALRISALPYASHPEYDERWRA